MTLFVVEGCDMGKFMDRAPFLKFAPERRLVMTYALRQSLEILQMSQIELAQWLKNEIEKNPLLELDSRSTQKKFDLDLPTYPTLHEYLLTQIRENFCCPREKFLAERILDQLDEKGFIPNSVQNITDEIFQKIISVLQTFDPPGIFARNIQETFLLQLKAKGKEFSLAYQLILKCFDQLLHSRYTAIQKILGVTDLSHAMKDLARLSFRPANTYERHPIILVQPDLEIAKTEKGWTLELIEDILPKFHIQDQYLSLEPEIPEEREALRNFKTEAKWISRSLDRRRKLLRKIGRLLLCKQALYLQQKGPLVPYTIQELADQLEIHESTLSRALNEKYISTPRGILPLRSLISATPAADTAREILEKLICNEDKQHPLTDDQLASELKIKGFPVARRTISKYRSQLKIGTATQRKHGPKKPDSKKPS